jgi:hypothetical protein
MVDLPLSQYEMEMNIKSLTYHSAGIGQQAVINGSKSRTVTEADRTRTLERNDAYRFRKKIRLHWPALLLEKLKKN